MTIQIDFSEPFQTIKVFKSLKVDVNDTSLQLRIHAEGLYEPNNLYEVLSNVSKARPFLDIDTHTHKPEPDKPKQPVYSINTKTPSFKVWAARKRKSRTEEKKRAYWNNLKYARR